MALFRNVACVTVGFLAVAAEGQVEWGNRAVSFFGRSGIPFSAQFEERHTIIDESGRAVSECQYGRIFVDRKGRSRLELSGVPEVISGKDCAVRNAVPVIAMLHDASGSVVVTVDLKTNRVLQRAEFPKTQGTLDARYRASASPPAGMTLIDGVECDEYHRESGGVSTRTWVSRQIQQVVREAKRDTSGGETVYRLFEIVLGEPDPALFAALDEPRHG